MRAIGAAPSRGRTRARVALACVALAACPQIALGVAWWAANLGAIPAYGDTSEYLGLAQTQRVDEYRTVFYPAFLRGSEAVASWLHLSLPVVVYLIQTAVAGAAIWYLAATLWTLTQTTRIGERMTWISARARRLILATVTLFLLTLPLVAHFADTILPDSLAASFLVAALAALVRIAVIGDVRWRTIGLALLSVTAAEVARPEKIYVVVPVIAVTLVVVLLGAVRHRRRGPGAGASVRLRWRQRAALTVLVVVPVAVVVGVDHATQTADYGRPPLSPSVMLFNRAVWPRLEEIRPALPTAVRQVVSAADARTFDAQNNNVTGIVERLRAAAGGSDHLLDETTRVALRCCWPAIAASTADDFGRYLVAPIVYPLDRLTGAATPTGWTDSRMEQARPSLTSVYIAASFLTLGLVQLPLLLLWLVRARPRPRRPTVAAIAVLFGVIAVNAALFAVTSGAEANIRYGMPSYVLLGGLLLWADLLAVHDLARRRA